MAKRKKRAKVQPKKRARLRRGSSAARKAFKQGEKGTKRTIARATPKAGAKKAAQKKERRMKPPSPAIESVVVVEEAAPGVITVAEFEERSLILAGLPRAVFDCQAHQHHSN
jgi:hypothetical protein